MTDFPAITARHWEWNDRGDTATWVFSGPSYLGSACTVQICKNPSGQHASLFLRWGVARLRAMFELDPGPVDRAKVERRVEQMCAEHKAAWAQVLP